MKKGAACLLALLLALSPLTGMAEQCLHARKRGNDFSAALSAHDPVDETYYMQAVLLGDSLCWTLDTCDTLPTIDLRFVIGQSPVGARGFRNIEWGEEKITMVEYVRRVQPRVLFVMLGSNGLDYDTSNNVLKDYHALLDELLDTVPGAELVLISVPPVRENITVKKYAYFTNGRVAAFNAGLLALAESHGVHYLDIYAPFLNAQGDNADHLYIATDGIHMTSAGADLFAALLAAHAPLLEGEMKE